MAIQKAKVITITSVKGGTGKTTLTLNLAGSLAHRKKRVLILDLDVYGGSIASSLNVEIKTDLYRLINDMNMNKFDNIENYVCSYGEYIDIIPAPKDPRLANKINCKYLSLVIKKVSMRYDVILMDTTHILNDINLLALDSSDLIFYTVTNDMNDLKNMKSMVTIYRDMENSTYRILLNKSIDKNRNCFTTYDMKNVLGTDIHYTIPESFYIKNIDKYVIDGKIISLEHPNKVSFLEPIINEILESEKK